MGKTERKTMLNNLSAIKGVKSASNTALNGLNDIANLGRQAASLPGDSMDQLRSLFNMVENYKKTNPNEFKAADDWIGKRCEYRKEDLF